MITLTSEEAQQVLDALESNLDCHEDCGCTGRLAGKLLRVKLSAPEPEPVVKLKELLEVQGRDGTWNYDPYFHGMYNGMEVMLAVSENREPVFRGAPERWLSKKGWVGLTDEEITATWNDHPRIESWVNAFARDIEAKLREKNG